MTMGYFYAKDLRDKEKMREVPRCPGYYKWWAKKEELNQLLEKLDLDEAEALPFIETDKTKEGTSYYCIYIGIEKSLYNRLKWHITQENGEKNVKNGTLSTLRLSIVSLFGKDPLDSLATNAFIDKLIVDPYPCESYEKAQEKEKEHLCGEHLYVLNIRDNKHPLAPISKLKEYRKKAKQSVQ